MICINYMEIGMIKLRSYQQDAVNAIRFNFIEKKRQYVEMPTGSGKTVTFLSYAKQYHKKILIIVPSLQLMHQIYETALKFYEPEEISRKGDRHDDAIANLHICTIHSLRGNYADSIVINEKFDLIIIDEAHHTQADSYKKFISNKVVETPSVRILGVTATPDRIDGKLIQEMLGECTFNLSILEMIEDGYLSDIEGLSVKTKIDLSDIDDHHGDFNLNQLYMKLCTESRNNMILDLCKTQMQDRKTLIFCINIQHSKLVNKLLNANGISCMHIDGTMKTMQKTSILNAFHEGEISTLCNCQLLTEGFDEPSINGIIIARPTRSRSLFTQMVGRGLRIFTGKKNCKIIDIVDNHRNLAGFNCLITDEKYPELLDFQSIKSIKSHIEKEIVKVLEYSVERVNLFDSYRSSNELIVSPSMTKYLEDNNIEYFEPISFDEANFLIWYDKLKKEFYGKHS